MNDSLTRFPCLVLLALSSATACSTPGAPPEPTEVPRVLVVGGDEDHSYPSVQAAVDAAPPGSVIELRPGEYMESVVLTRPVTLRGASWEDTALVSDAGDLELSDEALAELHERLAGARSLDERREIEAGMRTRFEVAPTLRVAGVDGARIENLRVTVLGSTDPGKQRTGTALSIEGGRVSVSSSAIAGSAANGLSITGDADVEILDTLVCGAWGSGIRVSQPVEGSGRILVRDCELRNNRYSGMSIGGGAPRTHVDRCRISGASWHGIRYDDSAPRITGCVFFDNQRSGIYASGKTRATLENNAFLSSGISCWFENEDRITNNTFVGTGPATNFVGSQSGVSVIGKSRPVIERNVFHGLPAGVRVSSAQSDLETAVSDGTLLARGNLFWANEADVVRGAAETKSETATELGAENEVADPGFRDVAALDLSWRADARAAVMSAGAPAPLTRTSAFPIRPEERRVLESRRSESNRRTAQRRTADATSRARKLTEDWTKSLCQIRSPQERSDTLESVRAALDGDDHTANLAALQALLGSLEVAIERQPFAPRARELARERDGIARVKALYLLHNSAPEPSDLELLLDAIEHDADAELMNSGSHLVKLFSGGGVTGRSSEVVLGMFERTRGDARATREVLRGLWGTSVSPEVEAVVLELAGKGSPSRHDAIYFGLSTFANKSPAVIEALFEACEDPDHNNSGRAVWGLGYGVPEASHRTVADFALLLFEARSDESTRSRCLRMLSSYGDASHVPALQGLAANELVPEAQRERAREVAARLAGN